MITGVRAEHTHHTALFANCTTAYRSRGLRGDLIRRAAFLR